MLQNAIQNATYSITSHQSHEIPRNASLSIRSSTWQPLFGVKEFSYLVADNFFLAIYKGVGDSTVTYHKLICFIWGKSWKIVICQSLGSQALFPDRIQPINSVLLVLLINTNIIKVSHWYLDYQSQFPQARYFLARKRIYTEMYLLNPKPSTHIWILDPLLSSLKKKHKNHM